MEAEEQAQDDQPRDVELVSVGWSSSSSLSLEQAEQGEIRRIGR